MLNLKNLLENPKFIFIKTHINSAKSMHLTKASISKAVLCGIFVAFLPIPFHMIIAAIIAGLIGGNIIIAASLVWINNPLTVVPLFYLSYKVGNIILHTHTNITLHNLRPLMKLTTWHSILLPLLTGSVILGLTIGLLASLITWLILYMFQMLHQSQKI